MQEAVVFDNFFASATSTLMVIGYLFHGNDFEYDTSSAFAGMLPAGNNPNLFSILRERGYHANLICLNGFQHVKPVELRSWADDLPPVWGTNDFPSLFARFDELTDAAPFAIYVWDLITHIEHSLAVSPRLERPHRPVPPRLAVADDAVGQAARDPRAQGPAREHDDRALRRPRRRSLDAWLQGRHDPRHGTVHRHHLDAARDSRSRARAAHRRRHREDDRHRARRASRCSASMRSSRFRIPASTSSTARPISPIRRTSRPTSRIIRGRHREGVFDHRPRPTRCSRARAGLEFYAHRLDPGNHCNLLHLFELDKTGRPVLVRAARRRRAFQGGVAGQSDVGRGARAATSCACKRRSRRAWTAKRALHRRARRSPSIALDPRVPRDHQPRGRDAFYRRARDARRRSRRHAGVRHFLQAAVRAWQRAAAPAGPERRCALPFRRVPSRDALSDPRRGLG